MKKFIKEMLSGFSGRISSKRVCGVIGWFCCLISFLYCTVEGIQAPVMVDYLLLSCMGLLGVDSVTSIWKNGKTNQ